MARLGQIWRLDLLTMWHLADSRYKAACFLFLYSAASHITVLLLLLLLLLLAYTFFSSRLNMRPVQTSHTGGVTLLPI